MTPAEIMSQPKVASEGFECALSSDGSVEVSPLETREMRTLTLPNDLRVLLVSDVLSDKAAAALNVGVGSLSDPETLPGLAHFCEHMLFLGTEKYPDEGSYNQFLAENSGHSNAYTASEDTNYHFELVVPPNDLESSGAERRMPRFKEALDRFSQFFTAPLFTESATGRELNAVDSEHERNLQSDLHRLYQVWKSSTNPEHPISRFSTGSKQTLEADSIAQGIDVRDALLEFHSKYYSSNLMTLCVAGPHSLDVMEEWVRELFSGIRNSDIAHPSTGVKNIEPLLPSQAGRMHYVVPIKDVRQLELTWRIPPTDVDYMAKSADYVSHLLGHEGKGSLLSYLKQKGWVNSMYARTSKDYRNFSFFSVSVDFTEEGAHHLDDIAELVFSYLALIKERGVQRWIHDEMAMLSRIAFFFQERSEPFDFTQRLSSSMARLTPKHYLTGDVLVREFNAEGIHAVLDALTPHNVNMFAAAKSFEERADRTERWYGTKYGVERIAEEKLERWARVSEVPAELSIPAKNIFIPTNLELIAPPLPDDVRDTEGPQLIEDNAHYQLHYKLDRTFKRPKATAYFDIYSNLAYTSPRHCVIAKLFCDLVNDELNEYSYDAHIGGLDYRMDATAFGFRLKAWGFNDKLSILLERIVGNIARFEANPERFGKIVDLARRSFLNYEKEQPYQHAMYAAVYVLEQPRWHIREYQRVLAEGVSIEEVNAFARELLRRLYVVGLVGGNVSEQWARDAMEMVRSTLGYRPLARSEFVRRRITRLPTEHEVLLRETHPNGDDNNSAIQMVYQIGPRGDIRRDVLTEVLADVLNKPVFHELRTVQQLGYMVFEALTTHEDVRSLYVLVQSPVADPDEVSRRVRALLAMVREQIIGPMAESEFEGYVNALIGLKAEREKSLRRRMGRFWGEILCRAYMFNRSEVEIEALRRVTKQDLMAFFDEYIAEDGAQRRALLSMQYGKLHAQPPPPEDPSALIRLEGSSRECLEVVNAIAFREWCSTYPVSGTRVCDVSQVRKHA